MKTHPASVRVAGLAGVCFALACSPSIAGDPAPTPRLGRLHDVPATLTGPLPRTAVRWIDSTVAAMPLRDQVAQMVMIWVLGDYTSTTDSAFAWAAERISTDRIGGVVMSLGSPIEVAAKVNALQRRAALPLLVSSDVEPGLGRLEGGTFTPGLLRGGDATVLPNNMAIGATGRTDLAREAGRIIGRESRAIGIHLAFAPTVDVNNNPANPVINVRSFGEDPAQVSAMSAAFVGGVQEAGVAATVKHFPGHGDTDTDSHLALPRIDHAWDRLDAVELAPFRIAARTSLPMIMTAHVVFAALDATRPATLSERVVTGLLRDRLGYQGVIVSDDLDMRAIADHTGVDVAAVQAIRAGCDVLLLCASEQHQAMAEEALVREAERDAGFRRRVGEAAARVRAMKQAHAEATRQRPAPGRDVVGSLPHRQLAAQLAARS